GSAGTKATTTRTKLVIAVARVPERTTAKLPRTWQTMQGPKKRPTRPWTRVAPPATAQVAQDSKTPGSRLRRVKMVRATAVTQHNASTRTQVDRTDASRHLGSERGDTSGPRESQTVERDSTILPD